MNPHDHVRLQHLADALNSAMKFVAGRSRSDLDSDEMLLFALVRAIEIAGEAASKVSVETRAGIPDLPWASIIGMRNRLVHAYFDINRDILWTTVTEAVPPLAEVLEKVLSEG
ncbi:MAG: HepT-like ribonuclease domain-containing protein [Methylovirgula sp.]